MVSNSQTVIVKPGTTLDLVTDATLGGKDLTIDLVVATVGATINVCARTKGNASGEERDHAANFIYSTTPGNELEVISTILPGPFDAITVPAGGKAVRCILKKGL